MSENRITPVTQFIHPNEKCYLLVEAWLTPWNLTKGGEKYQPETWSGYKRWRIAWVNRGDELAEYHTLSPHQDAPGIRIPSLWLHTYAELCGLADEYATRASGAAADQATLRELQAESTLVKDFLDQEENHVLMAKNHSTFGPLVRIQRDGFPHALRKEIEGKA